MFVFFHKNTNPSASTYYLPVCMYYALVRFVSWFLAAWHLQFCLSVVQKYKLL